MLSVTTLGSEVSQNAPDDVVRGRANTNFSPAWLMELATDGSPQGRMLLANAVGDLLNSPPGEAEINLIAEILLQIVRHAEMDIRRALAEKLARQKNAPKALMVWLANDELPVARPVLVLSDVLEDEDLLDIIQKRDSEYRKMIAQRKTIGKRVIQALIATHDGSVLQSLLENEAIQFDEPALRMLMTAAKHAENLKKPMILRKEINANMATSLYWWVSQELRQTIQSRFSIHRALLDEALEETMNELLSTRNTGIETITPEIKYISQQLVAARRVTSGLLITTLRRGQLNLFLALFSDLLNLSIEKVDTILSHPSGEFLSVCCRSQNILKPDFASIFLQARAARLLNRMVNPQELSQILRFYDKLTYADASALLMSWQNDPGSLDLNEPNMAKAFQQLHAQSSA